MRFKLLALLTVLAIAVTCSTGAYQDVEPLTYPQSKRVDHVDDYHGQLVPDPYRWLESSDSEEVRAWIKAQQEVTNEYLNSIGGKNRITERLTALWDFEKFPTPRFEGYRAVRVVKNKYFFYRNSGLQNQSVLYSLESLDGEPQVVIDPNELSDDGTVALSGTAISPNARYLAYGVSHSGSDWQEWRIKELSTGRVLDDHIQWVKFSSAYWDGDGKGFFYSRYDAPDEGKVLEQTNYYHKLYYHELGTAQSEDTLVYGRPDQKEWMFFADVSDDGHYLVIHTPKGTESKNLLFYKDLTKTTSQVVELVGQLEAEYYFVGNRGDTLFLQTNLDAPKGRIIAIDLKTPSKKDWHEIVPEATETLHSATVVGGKLSLAYLRDALSVIRLYNFDGTAAGEVPLPGLGTAVNLSGKQDGNEAFFAFMSYTRPSSLYRYDFATGKAEVFRKPELRYNPDDFESKQVFYTSKDGTEVPMTLTYKKGLNLTGDNPVLLYGYGGFNISVTPRLGVQNIVWMEMGGIFAVANLRGGGEYGEEWHKAGMLHQKQNVFDDFISAAEWLIDNGYTSTAQLAINGGSNGGLLVGAVMTQRPELFAAAVPQVGVLDMLRFHKWTIGWAWVPEYGSSDDPEQFKTLIDYSPLHNMKEGTEYPSTLITTADHDDRVVPYHSFKFAAALQHAHQGENPVLIRIESKAGHGAGMPTSKRIEASVDKLVFLMKHLGVTYR